MSADDLFEATPTSFDAFWAAYPRKVGKKNAQEKYERIIAKKIATHERIMEGLEVYKQTKEDWRDWLHPATWLHGQRWEDEPAPFSQGSNEHRPRPTPQYLRQGGRPKVTPEQKRRRDLRMEVFEELRREGRNPYLMPVEEVRALVDSKTEAQRRQS